MLNILIVDDEKKVRKTLSKMLALYCPNTKIVGEADGVEQAVDMIKKLKPNLVLLDINLSNDKTGFDILKEIKQIDFKLIFITAHDEYALKAIKYSALDYLLKPIDPLELTDAIQKAEQSISKKDLDVAMDAFIANFQGASNTKKIVLKTQDNIYVHNINDIVHCEAEKNYTTFNFINGTKLVVSKTLKEYEQLLTEYGFFRVHHSHLINMFHFERFEKKEGGSVIMKNEQKIPVSFRKRDEFLQFLSQL